MTDGAPLHCLVVQQGVFLFFSFLFSFLFLFIHLFIYLFIIYFFFLTKRVSNALRVVGAGFSRENRYYERIRIVSSKKRK